MLPSHWVASLDTLISMTWWQHDSRTPNSLRWSTDPRHQPSVVTGAMDTHKDPGCGRAMDLDMALDSIPGLEVISLFLTTFRSSVLPLSIAQGPLLFAFFSTHYNGTCLPVCHAWCLRALFYPTWAEPVAPGRSVGVSSASPLGLVFVYR